jgi:hypothetical protein
MLPVENYGSLAADCDSSQVSQIRYRGSLKGMLEKSELRGRHEFLASEARRFEPDVQIIVLGSLETGPKYSTASLIRARECQFATRKALADGVDPVAE